MRGLDISVEQFKKLKPEDRDTVMYNNLVHVRKKIESHTFTRKIHYIWLSVLTAFVGLKKYLGV